MFPNKTEDLNLSEFSMVTGINESKTLIKHISFDCKCKFDRKKCNSDQCQNKDKFRCECEKHHICEKESVSNPSTYIFENGKYLASTMDDSVISCDEAIESHDEERKTSPINFNEKNIICKTQNSYVLMFFY